MPTPIEEVAEVPRTQRRRRRPSPLCWLVVVIVLLPVAASTLHRSTGGWVPDGDEAWFARRAMQVGTTAPPLIGMASTASEQPTQGTNHPGPAMLYLVAGPYAISGWSPVGLAVGAGLLVAVALVAAVLMAWRTAGDRGAVAAGIAIAMMSARISQEWLVRPNNATLAPFPLLAALMGLWGYARRDRVGLAVALLASSLGLQTSLGVLPAAGAVVVGCVATWAWHRRHGLPARPIGRGGRLVAFAIAVMWLPPVVEVVVRAPGNLVDVGHFLLSQIGLVSRAGTYATSLGIGPAVASMAMFLTGVPGVDGNDFESSQVALVEIGDLAVLPSVLGAAVLVAALIWAFRHGSPALRTLWVLVGPALLVTTVALSRKPTDALLTQPYFITWVLPSVALAWSAVALALLEAAHLRSWRRAPRAVPRPVVPAPLAVGVVVMALFALLATSGSINRADSRRVAALSAQVRARVPRGTYLMWEEGFVPWNSTAKGLGADLLAHGYDIRFREWGGMVDETRRQGTARMAKLLVTSELPASTGVDVVARVEEPDLLLLVRLIPGGKDNAWCTEAGPVVAQVRSSASSAGPDDHVGLPDEADWTALLGELDVGPLVTASDDPTLRSASEDLHALVAVTLEGLRTGTLSEPPDRLRDALDLVVDEFRSRCDSRAIPGAKLEPVG